MRFSSGWIRLDRNLCNSDIYHRGKTRDPERAWFWTWLLLNVNVYPSKIEHNGKIINIPEGSIAYSYKYLADQTGLTVSKVRGCIDYLHKTERIDKHGAKGGSYLVVRKWKEYQLVDAESDKPVANYAQSNSQSSRKPIANLSQHNEQYTINNVQENNSSSEELAQPIKKKRVTRKTKKSKVSVTPKLVKLDFLPDHLQEFISGVSDEIRMRWLSRYCKATIQQKLQDAEDWSLSKGRKPKNVASLMNTFFRDSEHDKWKDEPGGVDPREKALSDELNAILEQARIEKGIDA